MSSTDNNNTTILLEHYNNNYREPLSHLYTNNGGCNYGKTS